MKKQIKGLAAILDAMQDGVYLISHNYQVVFMNKAMVDVFGDGTGKKCHQVINSSDQKCPWCRADEVFKNGETHRFELTIPRVGRTYEKTELPVKNEDGTVSKLTIYKDITRRKAREETIRASREDYERLFEHVGCGVYVSSKEGKFLNANQALLDMLGYKDKEQFLKIDITRDLYVRPSDRRRFQEMIERDGRVIDYEVDFKRKDGARIPVLMTSHVRYDNQNTVLGYEGIIVDQTQRRQMEENYQRLFEHVGCGVFTSTKEGRFLNANQALLDMLGYESKEQFLKIDITRDLYVRPDDRQRFREMIERDGRVIDYEVDFKRKDGKPISVLLTGHVIYDQNGQVLGYEGLNVDQTQRKQMERDLKEAHDFLNKIIKSSPNAIMAADLKGTMIMWNQGAEEILGFPAKDVLHKMNVRRIYPEGLAEKIMEMMRSPEYGGVGKLRSYPLSFARHDGETVEGNLSAAIIYDANGKELASVGIFVDLRERLGVERKLRQTQEQLLQSEKLAAMGRLTSQIAHELNNPLYGIMNTLELLKTEISPENKRRKLLEMSLSETLRLADMLRKMLSFSKPDQKEKSPTDINTVIDEILLLNRKQLQENDIKIKSDLADGLNKVNASKNQLRQVFLNMIGNARDAMPNGGTLTVTTKADDDNILIEISDTGEGIREEHQNKIFDAFFTTKGSVKGVGLGLSVCYGFIVDHGGDITVASKPGEGAAFMIRLPVCMDDASETDAGE
ncbi:PAS domain S-box protein [Thermodesulfobacteriota bacterium]